MINTSGGSNISRRPVNNMRGTTGNRPSPHSRAQISNNIGRPRNHEVEINGIYKNTQMTYQLTTLVGCTVQVQVTGGKHFEGILKTFSPEVELVLDCAHSFDPKTAHKIPTKDQLLRTLIVKFGDLVVMTAVDADTKYGAADSFTDPGISKAQLNGSVKEDDLKQLTPWDDGGASETHLDDTSGAGWDPEEMFRKNEENFGVKSSFDDSMEQYTTKLERVDTPEFHHKRAEAERLASEIEGNEMSRRNTLLENGDGLDEETRHSAVIRPSHNTTSPQANAAANTSRHTSKYNPPQRRVGDIQLSQSARMNSRDAGIRRESPHQRNKPQQQSSAADGMEKLKTWKSNFKLGSNSQSPAAAGSKSPKSDAGEQSVINESSKAVAAQPSAARPSPQAAATAAVPVAEALVTRSEGVTVATAPPHNAAVTLPADTRGESEKGLADKLSVNEGSNSTSTSEPKPETTPVVPHVLNPNAKEFVFNPKTLPVDEGDQPQKPHPPPSQPPLPLGHPGHQQQSQYHKPSKTAVVSVVDAARQPGRPEMPTPQQAMGQPLINPNHHPQPQQYHNAPFVMMQPPPHHTARLQRVPSYSGEGQPGPAHMFPSQQQFLPGAHHYVHNTMPGHVGIPQPIPGHQQMNMTAGPPHNAQLHQVLPPQQSQTAHHQQQQALPPHSTAATMNNGNPSPANGQHIHPQNPTYPAPPLHHGGPYVFPMVPQQGGAVAGQPSQPPLQPSPHNPSPSPVTMNNGGAGATPYHNYPPPQSQQFYPPQGSAAAAAAAAAVSQAAAAYTQQQQQFIYVHPQHMAGQYPQHQMPVYHYMPGGYQPHYPPQSQ